MIDLQARQKLAQKQLNDSIVKEIRSNTPILPEFDLTPVKETNKIGEEQLNMTMLNYELLKRIDESMAEMTDLLKEMKKTSELKPETTDGEQEIITQLKDLKEILYPTQE